MTDRIEDAPVTRASRTVRIGRTVKVQINERDRWMLDALARMQFLTTRQIARLLFSGSLSPARRRLRKLFDAGLIRVWIRSLNADNVYSLTPQGRQVLQEESEE